MGVAKDILQDAGDEPDADLLLENAEQRIYEIRSGRDSSALTPLSSSMVETLTNLQKISGPDADKYKGIPTGFRLLDPSSPALAAATSSSSPPAPVWARPVSR